ncbi:MAG: hypothetical protein NTW49_03370 [Bacteroidia bacterium]|nr:hypothetical protein [Bacteroidia bacterium]
MAKKRVIVSLGNASAELLEAIQKQYPLGWSERIIRVDLAPEKFFNAIIVETIDTTYLVKVPMKKDKKIEKIEEEIETNMDEVKEEQEETESFEKYEETYGEQSHEDF